MKRRPDIASQAFSASEIAQILTGAGGMIATGLHHLAQEGRPIFSPSFILFLTVGLPELLGLSGCGPKDASQLSIEAVDLKKTSGTPYADLGQSVENFATKYHGQTGKDLVFGNTVLLEVSGETNFLVTPLLNQEGKPSGYDIATYKDSSGQIQNRALLPLSGTTQDNEGHSVDYLTYYPVSQEKTDQLLSGQQVTIDTSSGSKDLGTALYGLTLKPGVKMADFQTQIKQATDINTARQILKDNLSAFFITDPNTGKASVADINGNNNLTDQLIGLLTGAQPAHAASEIQVTLTPPSPSVEVKGTDSSGKEITIFLPDLKDSSYSELLNSSISQFANTMTEIGVTVDQNKITTQLEDPQNFKVFKGIDGKNYILSTYTLTDKNNTPYLVGLVAEQDQNGSWQWNQLTLKDMTDKQGINVGTEGGGWLLGGGKPKSTQLAQSEVEIATPTYPSMSWKELQPSKDSPIDQEKFTKFIQEWRDLGFQLNLHPILPIFSSDLPDWLVNGNYSNAELQQYITDYVTQVVNLAAENGVNSGVIVNEAHLPGGQREDFFYSKLNNYDYIRWAVLAAKKAQPTFKLIYNDTYNHSANGATTALTKQIIDANPEIDFVGVQGHLGDWVPLFYNKNDVTNTLLSYGKPVILTENDVNLHNQNGTNADLLMMQSKSEFEFISSARKANVKTFIFWGLDSNVSWLVNSLNETDSNATMFDASYQPRPYFYSTLAALQPNQ